MPPRYQTKDTIIVVNGEYHTQEQRLINEEPLAIRIEGQPYSVIMRTPGEEIYHAAGFCLSEGLVDSPQDFSSIGYCPDLDSNVITATLTSDRRQKVSSLLDRRGFISQTSCGICGKALIDDLTQIVTPIRKEVQLNINQAMECVDRLPLHQPLYKTTASSHAAMILDTNLDMLSVAEDVGRHNALDKAIGKVFMNQELETAAIAVISSRISYEMVQKAARAKLAILLSMSKPTALAVKIAHDLGMSLACFNKRGIFQIFCNPDRIQVDQSK